MTQDMWITLAILLVAIVLFVTEWLRLDVVALGVVVALTLTNILTPGEAIAGFSSTAVILIAALFIVGGAVFQTGLAGLIGRRILKIAGTGELRLTFVLMMAVILLSGFMSNTGVVAVMMPAIISLAASAKLSPSKLLIPLAFASSLGGATTLIGTPPNIIVAEAVREAARTAPGLSEFEFFTFTPIALVLIVVGVAYMMLVGRRLLPERQPQTEDEATAFQMTTPGELLKQYQLPDNLFRLRVRSKSPLIDQTVADSRLGEDFDVNVLEVARHEPPRTLAQFAGQKIVMQSEREDLMYPAPDMVLQRDDVLIAQGEGNDVGRAAAHWNLAIQPTSDEDHAKLVSREVGIAEVVIPPRSTLIGKTLVDTQFGSAYRLTVLNMKRPDHEDKLDLKSTRLAFGDTLLVQGEWRDILRLKKNSRDFLVIGETDQLNGSLNRQKAPLVAIALAGMLFMLVTGIVPAVIGAMIAALFVVLTGCLTMDEAYDAIDWKSLVLIAGMLPMSTALESVGLVDMVANGLTESLGMLGPLAVMAGLFVLTAGFTQVLSNTATAVLLAPIALTSAQAMDVAPYAFLMAVAMAASMAFASPVASPVNTLVMGAGQYRFADYLKVGVPLMVVTFIASMIALPILFPF